MKFCKRCEEDKPLDSFSLHAKRKDGRQSYCKACVKAINADYYKRTPEKNVDRVASRQKAMSSARSFIWQYLQTHHCVDCGNSDPVVMEFDHVRGTKRFELSAGVRMGYSIDTLSKEIAKCDVRCANCHRKVTATRAGYWTVNYAPLAELG